jgi:hypothetical protein
MILKTKKKKYNLQIGGANTIKNSKIKQGIKSTYKTMKSSIINTKKTSNKCNFSDILLGEFKCKYESDISLAWKNECTQEYITKRIKNHRLFKNEPDKIYIKKYFEISLDAYTNIYDTTKSISKSIQKQHKITNVASILECMNYDMSNIFMVFYKINTFKFDKESDNYKKWTDLKALNENNINKSDKQILLEKFIDLIVNVLVKSFIDYTNKNPTKELKIESDFKAFLKSIDSNLEYSYNILFQKGKQKNSIIKINLNKFKMQLIQIFNSTNYIKKKNITDKLDKMYKEYQDNKESHTEQILSTILDKNKSSKFLVIILGMLLFATLMKFDVFDSNISIGSGTF